MIKFTISGPPVGKGRPRVVSRGGFARAYTPEKTAAYENLIKLEFERQCPGEFYGAGTALRMKLIIYQQPAKSDSKRKTAAKLAGEIRPTKKPDCSNVLKSIEDGLNGVAYADDAQIVEIEVQKYYDLHPRVLVEIEEA